MKEPVRGHLAPHAASVLMKLLYGARIARFDLLRQVNRLARNVHRWTDSDDRGLRHLMCYVQHTKHWRMVGWLEILLTMCTWPCMRTLTLLDALTRCVPPRVDT